jgi:hypothetical protein
MAASWEDSLGIEELFNDPMFTGLIDQALVDIREPKSQPENSKDGTNGPLNEIRELKVCEARAGESDRLQHAADTFILCGSQVPFGGARTKSADRIPKRDQLGAKPSRSPQ